MEKLLIDKGILVQKGKYDGAFVLINSETQGKIDSLELSENYLKLLQMTGKMDEALAYAKKHFSMLIRNNQKQKAINLFGKMKAKGAALSAPEDLYAMAGLLRDRHDYKKAFNCYADLIKSHNRYKHLPDAHFELAQIMYEQGKNNAKAEKVLKKMIQSFPEHHLVPEAEAYLSAIS